MVYVLRYLRICLHTVLWGTLGVLLIPFDRSGRRTVWIARSWLGRCLHTCGVEVEVEGVSNAVDAQPCILMANHQSVFDIAALVRALPPEVGWKFVAKKELAWIPFFGWALAVARQIMVDRSNRAKAVRSLERAVQRIREGANVIIFPEGTRSPDARLKQPEQFKSGGFHLALQAQVPIVPVTVSGSHRIAPKGSLRVESGTIRVRFGKPIPTRGLTIDDRGALKRQVHDAILAGYDPALQGPLPAPVGPVRAPGPP